MVGKIVIEAAEDQDGGTKFKADIDMKNAGVEDKAILFYIFMKFIGVEDESKWKEYAKMYARLWREIKKHKKEV